MSKIATTARPVPADVAKASGPLLEVWEMDPAQTPPERLRAVCAAAAEAIALGQHTLLAAQTREPATAREIASSVDKLIGAYSATAKEGVTLDVYCDFLAKEILATKTPLVALEAAVHATILEWGAFPSIKEVMARVEAQRAACAARAAMLESLPRRTTELIGHLALTKGA